MMPNPWLILGGVGMALFLTVSAYFYGCHVTNIARDKAALTAQLEATEAARQKEHNWQAALDAAQSQLAKERQDAQTRENKLRADIDDGARQLRIAVSRNSMPGDTKGTGGSDVEALELAPSARSAYSNLRASIIENANALKACQGYVRAVGGE